jgi:hypothetical protein
MVILLILISSRGFEPYKAFHKAAFIEKLLFEPPQLTAREITGLLDQTDQGVCLSCRT